MFDIKVAKIWGENEDGTGGFGPGDDSKEAYHPTPQIRDSFQPCKPHSCHASLVDMSKRVC